jgi:hypothetical protein
MKRPDGARSENERQVSFFVTSGITFAKVIPDVIKNDT